MNKIKKYIICRSYNYKECKELYADECNMKCGYAKTELKKIQAIPKECTLERFVFDDLWSKNG